MLRLSIIHKTGILFFFILTSHWLTNDNLPGQTDARLNGLWKQFSKKYDVIEFGHDGYFVRAVKNGHALFYKTWDFGWRFTRKSATDKNNSCSSCHTPKSMAYSFVNSDRYNPKLGKRVSFEESVTRCYIKHMNGFAPTIYDPAIRDIRIFSRIIAHKMNLVEGAIEKPVEQKPDNTPPKEENNNRKPDVLVSDEGTNSTAVHNPGDNSTKTPGKPALVDPANPDNQTRKHVNTLRGKKTLSRRKKIRRKHRASKRKRKKRRKRRYRRSRL